MTMQLFSASEYLKIDIASNFGLDKRNWDDRIDWFDTTLGQLNHSEEAFLGLVKEADEPAMFRAGVKAYFKAMRGEVIHYPISLDATASGSQILSLLVNCEKSARLCNIVDTGNREDLYFNIYGAMCVRMEIPVTIDPKIVKSAIMTFLYGSTAQPKKAFGEGDMLECFFDTMRHEAPGITQLNQDLLAMADPEALSYDWILPDNFHVHSTVRGLESLHCHFMDGPEQIIRKVNRPKKNDKSLGANIVHPIDGLVSREMVRRCVYAPDLIDSARDILTMDSRGGSRLRSDNDFLVHKLWILYKASGFLSARIFDHLEADNVGIVDREPLLELLDSYPKKPFDLLTVHDCFRFHPNYGNDVRRQYNNIMAQIAASDLLKFIVDQITGRDVPVTMEGDIAAQVMEANYALS